MFLTSELATFLSGLELFAGWNDPLRHSRLHHLQLMYSHICFSSCALFLLVCPVYKVHITKCAFSSDSQQCIQLPFYKAKITMYAFSSNVQPYIQMIELRDAGNGMAD